MRSKGWAPEILQHFHGRVYVDGSTKSFGWGTTFALFGSLFFSIKRRTGYFFMGNQGHFLYHFAIRWVNHQWHQHDLNLIFHLIDVAQCVLVYLYESVSCVLCRLKHNCE